MYPVAHVAVAVGAVKAGERWLPLRWLPLDYRFVALGALLPDVIDKPLRVFGIGVPDGHTFGHTLLLSSALIAAGLLAARRSDDTRLLMVGLGTLGHLLVDPVMAYPRTLFWPLLGLDFGRSNGIPGVYLAAFDTVLLAAFIVFLARSQRRQDRFAAFLRTGGL